MTPSEREPASDRGPAEVGRGRRQRAFQPPDAGRPAGTVPGVEGLRGLYERYCAYEARALLSLVPREGLRALYREARERASSAPDDAGTSGDTIALVVRYARDLLPLPPFEVWLESYLADRRPFLDALGVATVPERTDPVLVDLRSLDDGWMVGMHLVRGGDGWRGFLRFHRPPDRESWQTADIFRGSDPDELRERFRGFHVATLRAFLRSVLP